MGMEINQKIRSFIEQNLVDLDDEIQLSEDDNIFELGFVNSLFAMSLLNYVEKEFNLVVNLAELNIENFNSINHIVALVKRSKQKI